tara:strand:+ start:316 stop:732 length:417 start_codon:yes stop_codon:yes gene_type:complete
MPTRVEKLEKRKTKVRKKVAPKMAKARAAGKPIKKMFLAQRADRKLGKLNKKIDKTKARVATRAKKKVAKVVKKTANVLKRARKASAAYKSVKANPKSTKGNVKRATNKLNRLGKKAGGDKVMYPSMSYMDTFPKKKK